MITPYSPEKRLNENYMIIPTFTKFFCIFVWFVWIAFMFWISYIIRMIVYNTHFRLTRYSRRICGITFVAKVYPACTKRGLLNFSPNCTSIREWRRWRNLVRRSSSLRKICLRSKNGTMKRVIRFMLRSSKNSERKIARIFHHFANHRILICTTNELLWESIPGNSGDGIWHSRESLTTKPFLEAMGIMQLASTKIIIWNLLNLCTCNQPYRRIPSGWTCHRIAIFWQNVQSMLKLGRAPRRSNGCSHFERYSYLRIRTLKIKMAIRAMGAQPRNSCLHASTKSCIFPTKTCCHNSMLPTGLAAALCHFYQSSVGNAKSEL